MKSFYSKCDLGAMWRETTGKCLVYVGDTTLGHSLLALCPGGESDAKGEHRELGVSMGELRVSSSPGIRHPTHPPRAAHYMGGGRWFE